jgi:hypothetical protein
MKRSSNTKISESKMKEDTKMSEEIDKFKTNLKN